MLHHQGECSVQYALVLIRDNVLFFFYLTTINVLSLRARLPGFLGTLHGNSQLLTRKSSLPVAEDWE